MTLPEASDLSRYGFSEHGPWNVDADELTWMRGLDHVRNGARDSVPRLLHSGRIPPLGRLLSVTARVGGALAIWAITEKRHDQSTRRSEIGRAHV